MDPQGNEKRNYPRVNVGPECKVTFQVGQQAFIQLQVVDIGRGGCCVVIPAKEVGHLVKGITLDQLQLQHPKLPTSLLHGEVCWVLGKASEDENNIALMGITLHDLPSHFSFALGHLVDELKG